MSAMERFTFQSRKENMMSKEKKFIIILTVNSRIKKLIELCCIINS